VKTEVNPEETIESWGYPVVKDADDMLLRAKKIYMKRERLCCFNTGVAFDQRRNAESKGSNCKHG